MPHQQFPNPYVTPELCFTFHYFAVRKLHFLLRAKALVAFPGGYGTFDELFETLTLIQTRKIEPMPVVLVGEGYWRRAVDFDFLSSEGVIDAEDREWVVRYPPEAGATLELVPLTVASMARELLMESAELVVLSACETGRGEQVTGEGIVGLVRALQYAGARAIVASQWQVADWSTAALMVAFHEKLRAGLAKDEALRQAMAQVQGKTATAHPYYWAAFFLTGDPQNSTLAMGRPGGAAL